MPTYQYRCSECGNELEVVQKFTDDPLSVCDVCQGQLRKVYSAVGIVFKGSGFYATDNRTKGKSQAAKPAAATSGESSGNSTATSAPSSSSSASSTAPAAAN
ncbi:MAG TPA: zinc ribbon domain-containing protein [Propionibacteriaceae bacterium]|nr:zinc ribbon domain-containing protein [Propionibacteriaceae bacterium]